MSAGSRSEENRDCDCMDEGGLMTDHSYAIIGAKVVKDNEGTSCNILKLRNPYGDTEWNGAWSDTSKKWTSKSRQECDVEIKEDGIFWMSFDDLVYNYNQFYICEY